MFAGHCFRLIGASILLPGLASAVDWDGAVGNFGTATNWVGDVVPSGTSATIANGGQAVIGDGGIFNLITLGLGGHSGVGTVTQTGGFLSATQVSIGGDDGGGGTATGTYNITGGSLEQGDSEFWVGTKGGTGTLNIGGDGYVSSAGSIVIGRDGAAGHVNLTGNAILEMTNGGGDISLGVNSPGFTSTMTVGGVASVISANELYVGWFNNNTNKATLTIGESASVTVANGLVVGRANGAGALTVSGNALLEIGGGLMAGADGTGRGDVTINDNARVTAAWIAVPLNQNASGSFTMNGGSVTAIANSGDLQGLVVYATGSGTSRLVNLNGGTLTVNGIRKIGGNQLADVNFNGGTVRTTVDNADFLSGFTNADLEVKAGGLSLDTNGHAITITQGLSGAGGLSKLGEGMLTLSGANAYLGNTVIGDGALSITSGFLSDLADILLFGGSVFDLNFSGIDTVRMLVVDGVAQPAGTWGAIGSGADYERSFITGEGVLKVTSVPEPGVYGLLMISALGVFVWRQWRRAKLAALLGLALVFAEGGAKAQDIVISTFGSGYGAWVKTGTAFDQGPATGSEVQALGIQGSPDNSVATSEKQGDGPQGTLTSPAFQIQRDYISFLIAGGDYEYHNCLNLLVGGKVVRSATGRNSDVLTAASWDVREFAGMNAQIQIVDHAGGASWGHINVDQIVQTNSPAKLPVSPKPLYGESLRPKFHFTARQWTMDRLNPGMRQEGWINDLNGMIYYDGEYHLFAQRWNKCWIHAVSTDLVHWEELEPAFWEEQLNSGVQSGTCVIDYNNTSGLSPDPAKPPMVAFWSRADNASHGISYSLDHGRTWTFYSGNPFMVFPERDPKVFWYQPTNRWVMILYGTGQYHIFTSTNLINWTNENHPIPNSYECPDFFEMAVDGNAANKKWVLIQGNGRYSIGTFNGTQFTEETPRYASDLNDAMFYATQSFHNTDTGDGRRIQMAWMRGSDFPNMPFNQQISFPCELSLKTTPKGLRLYRKPVSEIALLHNGEKQWNNLTLQAGGSLALAESGDAFHIKARVQIPEGAKLTFDLRGVPVALTSRVIVSGPRTGVTMDGLSTVEILLDRASVEAFANDGEISSTRYIIPQGEGLSVKAEGGAVTIESLEVYPMKSMWESAPALAAAKGAPMAASFDRPARWGAVARLRKVGTGYRLTARVSDRDGVKNVRLAPGRGRLVKGGREIVAEFDEKPRQIVLTMEDEKGNISSRRYEVTRSSSKAAILQ
jgi:autotransporter-associated beta strand protein